jgi:predicted NACHT family NTPase
LPAVCSAIRCLKESDFPRFCGHFSSSSGGITVNGEAWSQAIWQNTLEFTFEIDQAFLVETLSEPKIITGPYSKTSLLQQTERPVSGSLNG